MTETISFLPKAAPLSKHHHHSQSQNHSFLRRVAHNWGIVVAKARKLSSTPSHDALVDELFETSSSSAEFFPSPTHRPRNPDEDKFLELYKHHMSIEKISPPSEDQVIDDEDKEVNGLEDATPVTDLCNYGPCLWAARREEWTRCEDPEKVKERALRLLIADIPKHSYPAIYDSLVDKRKPLKNALNLGDLAAIINAGWVANERWVRAAQGL